MTNLKTKLFIKNQLMQLKAKVVTKKLEYKSFLDTAYNFSLRATSTRDAIDIYKSRISALENEKEFTNV